MKSDNPTLIKKGLTLSVIVGIGKILGFIKQAVIAWAFGANIGTDLYFAADSFIAMFGQIQLASIAPSILTSYIYLRETNKRAEAEKILNASFSFFPFLSLIIIIILIALSEYISTALGVAYSTEQRLNIQKYLIILSPVILFTAFSGVAQGVLDSNEHFSESKLLSLFFSISIIISIVLLHNSIGIYSMIVGFLFGYGTHTLYVINKARKIAHLKIINSFKVPAFSKVFHGFVTLALGNSIVDLGHLVDKIIASSLESGSISYLYYGQVISSDLVNAVIITTIGTILLPKLTKDIATEKNKKGIIENVNTIVISLTTLLGIVSCLYIIVGDDLVHFFFERGSFDHNSTINVYRIAVCYSIGFSFIAYREVLVKLHYAYMDTLSPMKNGIIGVAINIILSMILAKQYGACGIAIATTISIALVSLLLSRSIKKHLQDSLILKSSFYSLIKVFISLCITSLIGISLKQYLDINYFIRMMITCTAMIIVFTANLLLLGEKTVLRIIVDMTHNTKKTVK